MSKKIVALVLCLMLCVSVFAACGTTPAQNSGTKAPESSKTESTGSEPVSSAQTNEEHPNWVSDTPVTFKVWSAREGEIADLNTNDYILWLEDQTNVDLEFEQADAVDAAEKLNLSLSSGVYPDIYWTAASGANASTMSKYGMAGVFVPLNDYIEQYGNNVKQIFSDNPWLESGSTSPDGNLYMIPTYSGLFHVAYSQKMWIDQAWLDNLGLEMPTTTDEFRNVLTAFKEQDANGNGDPNDEIPLGGTVPEGWHGDPTDYLMCAFIYDDGDKMMTVINDEIDAIYNKDEYKAGLKYVAGLYADGLIYPDIYTSTSEQIKNLASQDSLGCFAGGHCLFADLDSDFYRNTVTVPPLKGPEGVQTAAYYGMSVGSGGFYITSSCENPEAAFKLADFMYGEESTQRLRHGIPGVDWDYASNGEKTCDGRDAKYVMLTGHSDGTTVQNSRLMNSGLFFETNDLYMGLWAEPEYNDVHDLDYLEPFLYLESKKYEEYKPEQTLPPLVFTDEENAEIADVETDIKKYRDEQKALFVTGQKDIDAEWDAYVQQLENLGLSRLIEIYNQAYKRQYVK